MSAEIFRAGDFVRRVVDELILTRGHLDRSYSAREVAGAMDDVFRAPGPMTHVPTSTCVACASRTTPCLGVPAR